VEKRTILGGSLISAGMLKEKAKINWLIDWLRNSLVESGVTIMTKTDVTKGLLDFSSYDSVIIACGAIPDLSRIPVIGDNCKIPILQAVDYIDNFDAHASGKNCKCETALVVGGGLVGCETALHMAQRGTKVSLITRRIKDALGFDMDPVNRYEIITSMFKQGVAIIDCAQILKIENSGVRYSRNELEILKDFDCILLAQGFIPNIAPIKYLSSLFSDIHVIGDCASPRNILSAIYEGFITGYSI
jgi:pyruvate/2-oxoglutarate dehydrogenase complex dihydrolipoamide dehydrogenase (E3) component